MISDGRTMSMWIAINAFIFDQLTSWFAIPSMSEILLWWLHSQYLTSVGGSALESFWTLGAGLRALGVSFSNEMFLPCLLHPKMNTKPKFSLPLKGEYLQYLLSWVLSVFHSLAGFLISFTVHAVECLGMQKVLYIQLLTVLKSSLVL